MASFTNHDHLRSSTDLAHTLQCSTRAKRSKSRVIACARHNNAGGRLAIQQHPAPAAQGRRGKPLSSRCWFPFFIRRLEFCFSSFHLCFVSCTWSCGALVYFRGKRVPPGIFATGILGVSGHALYYTGVMGYNTQSDSIPYRPKIP
jgi:hypothetical protein